MSVFGDRDDGPLLSRGGYGDRTAALNLLARILAAMRLQEKTGEGQFVEVTLQRTGIWVLASDVTNALFERVQPEKTSRKQPPNPIWNIYRTADDRLFAPVSPYPAPDAGQHTPEVLVEAGIAPERIDVLIGNGTLR